MGKRLNRKVKFSIFTLPTLTLVKIIIIIVMCSMISAKSTTAEAPVEPLNILLVALNNQFSHFSLNIHVANTLAAAGHHVHVLANANRCFWPIPHDPESSIADRLPFEPLKPTKAKFLDQVRVTEIALTPIPYPLKEYREGVAHPDLWFRPPKCTGIPRAMMQAKLIEFFKALSTNVTLMDDLRSRGQFDVGIAETFDLAAFPLFHLLGVRETVATSAMPLWATFEHILGLPQALTVPELHSALPNDGFDLSPKRRQEIAAEYREKITEDLTINAEMDKYTRAHVEPDFPTMVKLLRRLAFYFVNTIEPLDFVRPTLPKIKYFGGIHMENPTINVVQDKQHHHQTDKQDSEADDGVVLMAFGSMGMPTPDAVIKMFARVFVDFPRLKFVVKVNPGEEMVLWKKETNGARNVETLEWVDQKGLLASGRVRCFVSHCGQNSLLEAVAAGVPTLGLPFFADQNYIAAQVQFRGIGLAMSRWEVTRERLVEAIQKIVYTDKYVKNAVALRDAYRAMPFRPAEVLIKSIESLSRKNGGRGKVPGGNNIRGVGTPALQYLQPNEL